MWDDYREREREARMRLAELEARMRTYEFEEPKRKKKTVKKKKFIETLQIFRGKRLETFSSENCTWFIKTDGVWIHSPKKVNAENSTYFPMVTIDKINISRETMPTGDSKLQKYLEQNLK